MNDLLISLEQHLGKEKILNQSQITERYYHIWRMDEPFKAKAYLLPSSTTEVSIICKICSKFNQPIIVYGGLTNLVGSTETTGEEVILSMEKMNDIEEVDVISRTMLVQAGTILQNVQEKAINHELLFPLNFGAKGSAQIGGCISTNAGGLRVLKYGMTRNLILGLEVVLMDGTILSSLKKIVKDNSAYDLKQIFIGSEGTLGIVTKASLKLVESPRSRNSAFLAFNDFANVVSFLKFIDKGLAGYLSGFEVIWQDSYEIMTAKKSRNRPPIPHGFKYYVLVESLGANQDQDKEAMLNLIQHAIESELALDAVVADTQSDLAWFWDIREDVKVLADEAPFDQHFDVSAPINALGAYVDDVQSKLLEIEGVKSAFPFGHLADGNIHFIVGKDSIEKELTMKINEVVYSPLESLNGSVSAEHGIGLHKKSYLKLCRSETEIELMKKLKRTLDPLNLLNRGKVLNV